MKQKLETAYKTIGEVAKDLNLVNLNSGKLNTHTIRYWETQFKQIKPKILNGNRRYYDNDTIEKLKKVKYLLGALVLFAAIAIPIPDPQIKIPKLPLLDATFFDSFFAKSG